jgi:hypothetical protein
MKIAEKTGTVTMVGINATQEFRIKASRKAFEILSAGLYSDKVRAIVRELSTNAADAHVAAGKASEPFEVHLPNNLEPWFSVKDYGIGLSDDAVLLTYTTYFESNKTDSDEFTGCLGLGSKSPFSYTDSFTVESRFNGVKRIYNAFLSEEGFPAIAKLTEEATDEPNGLTVSFPVKSTDFYAFHEKAVETLVWFKTQPKVTGYHNFEYPERNYLRKTEKYGVRKVRSGRSFAVMGNVAYPIEEYEFLTGYDDETSRLKNLVQWGVELYVNIGDCDISASREKLGYDKRTVRVLREALKEALADLEKEITKEISNKPTLWQARVALHEVRRSFNGFDLKAVWGDEELLDHVKVDNKEVEIDDGNGGKRKITMPRATVEILKPKSKYSDKLTIKKDHGHTIYADGTPIFLNDERGGYAAVRRYMEQNSNRERVYFISKFDEDWLKETGISEVAVKTSTLPKPPRQAYGSRGTAQKAKVYEFCTGGGSGNESSLNAGNYWKPAEVDLDEGGVYVEILYFSYRMKEGEETAFPSGLEKPLNLLRKLGKEVTIYGIRPADLDLLEKSEGEWLTFKDYVLETLKDLEKVHHENWLKSLELDELTGGSYYSRTIPFETLKDQQFAPDSLFGNFLAQCLEAKKVRENSLVKSYGDLRHQACLIDPDCKGLTNLRDSIFERYPILAHLDTGYRRESDEYVKAVSDYIRMIDSQPPKEEVEVKVA